MPGHLSDKLKPSVKKEFKLKGTQLNVLEQQGGFKPVDTLAQQAGARATGKGNRGTHISFLSLPDLRLWPGGLLSVSSRILGQVAALSIYLAD